MTRFFFGMGSSYSRFEDMYAEQQTHFTESTTRRGGEIQNIAIIGHLKSGKSSFANTSLRVLLDDWGEEFATICPAGEAFDAGPCW